MTALMIDAARRKSPKLAMTLRESQASSSIQVIA
tara:strand:+ start:161 stop:262 length:102 start_codon:yes stop_codon:yes gene_type:complete